MMSEVIIWFHTFAEESIRFNETGSSSMEHDINQADLREYLPRASRAVTLNEGLAKASARSIMDPKQILSPPAKAVESIPCTWYGISSGQRKIPGRVL